MLYKLDMMLMFIPSIQERLTAQEAMAHAYFDPVRADVLRNSSQQS